ncbi:hypothetical protein [Xanthocytophaga agilis]
MKAYPTSENLALYFGFAQATASEYIRLLLPLIKTALNQYAPLKNLVFKD